MIMGFRFRKSIKLGPARITLSKSGVGYSIGGPGARITKKANGNTMTTIGIPGTGIGYITETSAKKSNKKRNKTWKKITLITLGIFTFPIGIIFFIMAKKIK